MPQKNAIANLSQRYFWVICSTHDNKTTTTHKLWSSPDVVNLLSLSRFTTYKHKRCIGKKWKKNKKMTHNRHHENIASCHTHYCFSSHAAYTWLVSECVCVFVCIPFGGCTYYHRLTNRCWWWVDENQPPCIQKQQPRINTRGSDDDDNDSFGHGVTMSRRLISRCVPPSLQQASQYIHLHTYPPWNIHTRRTNTDHQPRSRGKKSSFIYASLED